MILTPFSADWRNDVARLVNSGLTQSGSNANGNFLRFQNGYQILYKIVLPNWNVATYQDFTFPATATEVISQTFVVGSTNVTNAVLDTASSVVNRPLVDRFRFAFRGTLASGATADAIVMVYSKWS